jgi:hypothetical protein
MNNYSYSDHLVNTSNGITDYTQSPELRAIYDQVTVNNFAESVTTRSPTKSLKESLKEKKRLSMIKRIKLTMKSWFRKFK